MNLLITGGSGFIGSALIRYIIKNTSYNVVNVDKLTYAGNLDSLSSVANNSRYSFEKADICNSAQVKHILDKYVPDIIIHLAAETHVDQSIEVSSKFIQTNIIGTYILLEETRKFWTNLRGRKKNNFRFHHVSTDEVFGDLENESKLFTEETPYSPSSPYSASKASADHLVRAWHRTYKLPVIITNCSNNYGPYQFPEKLVPLMIINALKGKTLPVYGNGNQIRDWLHVEDHVKALLLVAINGKTGETYNIGGNNEIKNIDVVYMICKILNELSPSKKNSVNDYKSLITFVKDRPGHDKRYAIDTKKISKELKWKPQRTFKEGMEHTIRWYFENINWCEKVINHKNTLNKLDVTQP